MIGNLKPKKVKDERNKTSSKMSNFKGFRSGKKLPKKDVQRRVDSYNRQVEIYDKLPLDELKTEYATGNKGKPLKGVYKLACEHVTNNKLNQARLELNKQSNETEAEGVPETSKEADMVTTAGGAIEGE